MNSPGTSQAEIYNRLLKAGRGPDKTAREAVVGSPNYHETVLPAFFPWNAVQNSMWDIYRNNTHWDSVAEALVMEKNHLKDGNLRESIIAYNIDDAIYLEKSGKILEERYGKQTNLTKDEKLEMDSAIKKYKGYADQLRKTIQIEFFPEQKDQKPFEQLQTRFPSPAGKMYTDTLMEVAKQESWMLSMASSIPCVIGWSCMAQWLYVKHGMHLKPLSKKFLFHLYFINNLSAFKEKGADEWPGPKPQWAVERPEFKANDKTEIDRNGIEWDKISKRPVLSMSARKLISWIQALIIDSIIDVNEFKVLVKQARVFIYNEIGFANNATSEDIDKQLDFIFKEVTTVNNGLKGVH